MSSIGVYREAVAIAQNTENPNFSADQTLGKV